MTTNSPVLIVSGERACRERFAATVGRYGLRPVCCSSLQAARALLARESLSLAFCSELLPDGSFDDLIQAARKSPSPVPVIVFSRLADWPMYLKAVSAGAFDYIRFPDDTRQTTRVISTALNQLQSLDRSTRDLGGIT